MGAKYVLDGTDTCAAMFNPEGDAGDVEMWELICPMIYLSRRIKANSGGAGRHRGGSSFESLLMLWKTPFWELQNLGCTRMLTAGVFGGYGSAGYVHNIKRNDLREMAAAKARPAARRRQLRGTGADGDLGRADLQAGQHDDAGAVRGGDLYLSVMKGGPGLGDALLRRPAEVARDVAEGHLLTRFADSVYGVVLDGDGAADEARPRAREEFRAERCSEARPARVVGRAARAGDRRDMIEPVRTGLAESMTCSPRAGRRSTAASGTSSRTSSSKAPTRPS